LTPAADPDRSERVAPAAECRRCDADLGSAVELADGWAQVWDILPAVLRRTQYELPRWRCGCGAVTTATPPYGRAGTVAYGPNLNAAAILLGSEANVPVERTAMLIGSLFGVEVSTGFVARAGRRLAAELDAAGFDEAMKTALCRGRALWRRESGQCAGQRPR
jgi:transposase